MVYEGSRYYEAPDIFAPIDKKVGRCKLTGGRCDSQSDCRRCNVPIIRAIAGRGGTPAAQDIVRSWTAENMEDRRQ